MQNLFFLLSGENPTLPTDEATSILEAEGLRYQIIEELTAVLRLRADVSCIQPLITRAGMTKICALEMLSCRAYLADILIEIDKTEFKSFLNSEETFAVRVRRVRESSSEIEASGLERKIGTIISENTKARVDLKSPQKIFFGVLTDNRFIFGLKLTEIRHGAFIERGPRRKTFFHPSAMQAKIARCMVNLAHAKKNDVFLDPFCGTGSLLIEAGLIGCQFLGIDAQREMVEGCLKNLRLFNLNPKGMFIADSRLIPLISDTVNCIATDPPYGTSTVTKGLTIKKILEGFFSSIFDILNERGYICLAAPQILKMPIIGRRYGFRHIKSHFIYIHSGLTREIAVFKRGDID